MTLIKKGKYYHSVIRTERGTRTITTKCKDKGEALKVVRDSHIKELEQAARSTRLTSQAIGKILTGNKLTVLKAIDEWEQWLMRQRSSRTAADSLGKVRRWARDAKVENVPPSSIKEEDIGNWINAEGESKYATRVVVLSAIRSFFRFCTIRAYTAADPSLETSVRMEGLSHEQKESKEVALFTQAQINRIVHNTEGFWQSATLISAETGLRLGDVAQLEWACFSTPGHLTVWTDKRNRRVSYPISEELSEAIASVPVISETYLFPEEREKQLSATRRSNLSVQFTRLLKHLKLDAPGRSFHSLRHTLITRLDREGKSLADIGKIVGHSSEETTKGYIKKK